MAPSLAPVDGGEEHIDLGVGPGDLLSIGRSADLATLLHVRTRGCSLHQCHLPLLCQVLQLYRQQGEVSDGDHPRLLVPVQYVLLLQPVRVLAYSTTSGQCVALLDVVECEESVVAVAHVVGAEVDAGAVACRTDHQLEHRLWDVELLSSW